MPSSKTTYFLGVLALVGTGYLFFFESRLETTDQKRLLHDRVLRLTASQVERIQIRRDHWTSALIERVDATAFRVVDPVAGAIDSGEVNRLLSVLEFMESRSSLPGDGADEARLYQYGLSPPRLEITLGTTDGSERQLAIGKEPSAGGGVYFRLLGDDAVHVVDRQVLDLFDQTLDRLAGISAEGAPGGG